MLDEIGNVAGSVWLLLGEKGEFDVSRLARTLKLKGEVAYQALGWLAREGKVRYQAKGRKTCVALTEWERAAFDASRTAQAPKAAACADTCKAAVAVR